MALSDKPLTEFVIQTVNYEHLHFYIAADLFGLCSLSEHLQNVGSVGELPVNDQANRKSSDQFYSQKPLDCKNSSYSKMNQPAITQTLKDALYSNQFDGSI